MRIEIDGETYEITHVREIGYGDVVQVDADSGEEFIVSKSRKSAGRATKERWADMAENDPREFEAMVGAETLVAWSLGQLAGPGNAKVRSLKAWLGVVADHPEEEWASYDGQERDVGKVDADLKRAIGYAPKVAYRHN